MWIARGKDNQLWIFGNKPVRDLEMGIFDVDNEIADPDAEDEVFRILSKRFPEVTWENSPIELVAMVGKKQWS